jgi:tRNA dimethylallyltransferase
MPTKKPPLIVILGPTASGKTGLSIALAQCIGGEVISADSRQIYRGLDIGTEKITHREMCGVPHHCIDIASPRRSFSVAQWRRHAERAIADCYRRGAMPIVAGGTGLYIDALVYGIDFPSVKPDMALRHELETKPARELYATLQKLDPARARTIEKQNHRRLIRAIEIARALGKVPTLTSKKPLYDVTWLGVNPPFPVLEERIATRLDQALKKGLITETKKLREELGLSWKRINELGMEYRACGAYLHGELPKAELRDTLIREVRRYAKRQLTWLKRYKEVVWHESAEVAIRASLIINP